jgi:hypothetical protein
MAINITIPESGNILVGVSGGLDSAAGLYLLCKSIKDNNLPNRVVAVTWRRAWPEDNPRTWNITHSERVIAKVNELMDDTIIISHEVIDEPIPGGPDNPITDETWHDVYHDLQTEHNLTQSFNFITLNPPLSEMQGHNFTEFREEERDDLVDEATLMHKPFRNIDKREVAGIYIQHDLMDSLFPETRSCEGDAEDTNNYTTPCSWCWWCKEKHWAFNQH